MEYFNYNYYISKYNDLKHLTKDQAINHFNKYGIKERRKFNKLLDNFDYNYYITHYKDLSKFNYLQACKHYINHGIKERRRCSPIVDKTINKTIDMYNINYFTPNVLDSINKNINNFNKSIDKYKNILFICGDYPGYGGAATNCYNLQTYYNKRGHNTYGFYYNFENGNNAKYESNSNYIITDLLNIKDIKFIPDLIILKSFINFDLKSIFKCPIYYLIGGIYLNNLNKYYYNINSLEEQNKYINKNVINQIKNSTLSFVNSNHTQNILMKYYNIKTGIFYSSFIQFVNKTIKIDYNFEKRKYDYGLIVSNFNRTIKNISKSIEFLKNKKNVILIGKNSSNYNKYGFTCVDLVNNNKMLDYYKQIKYIVQDSFYESCSNVKIEALYNGCKLKPCIVVSSTQYPGYGGAATNAYNIIKYLRKLGFNVCGIFFHNILNVNYNPEKINGIFLYNSNNINEDLVRRQVKCYLNSNPNICFAKNNNAPHICKKIFQCKTIYLVSGISYFNNLKLSANHFLKLNYKIDESRYNLDEIKCIKTSDLILCNSVLTKDIYNKLYYKYICKHKNLSNEIIDTTDMVLQKKNIYQSNKNKCYDIIICCSNMNRIQKNMELVKNIFKHPNIKKYKKLVIGKDSKNFFKDIENLSCLDLINQNILFKYLQDSKFTLITSFFDSNPNISKEAIINGCIPIISNNIGGSEMYPNILICKNLEVNEWVNKLEYLLDNYKDYVNIYNNFIFNKSSIIKFI